jgi:hypothetical protein
VPHSRRLDFLVVAAVGVLVTVAAADSLRSMGSSPTQVAIPDSHFGKLSLVTPRSTRNVMVRDVGDRWADDFARAEPGCAYMTQALCERLACEHVEHPLRKMRNCKQPTRAYRETFEGALVFDVAFKDNRAAARLSNGAVIELWGDGGTWRVSKLGGDAGRQFFESSQASRGDRFPVITDAAERRESP